MDKVSIIIAPYHAGASEVRVGKGPRLLLEAGLPQAIGRAGLAFDLVEILPVDRFEGEIGRSFEVKRRIANAVSAATAAGEFPLILAGNCNASVGVHAGLAGRNRAVVWFDAHPDFDTPDECLSGYFDGMAVATLAGQCWQRLAATIPGFRPFELSNFLYCGIRDFEHDQLEKVERHGIPAVYGSAAMQGGYAEALSEQLNRLLGFPTMVHLDLDCLDTSVGQANEYAAPGGLTASDLVDSIRCVGERTDPVAMTIASFNPELNGSAEIAAAAVAAVGVLFETMEKKA